MGSREGGGRAGQERDEGSGRACKVALQEALAASQGGQKQPWAGATDKSGPTGWVRAENGGNKEQGKGRGFPKGMPMHPTDSNGEKRMLNEPMISAEHSGFFRTTAKGPRTAEPPLGKTSVKW